MPAFVKRSVGSFEGTREEDSTMVCRFFSKYLRNRLRISAAFMTAYYPARRGVRNDYGKAGARAGLALAGHRPIHGQRVLHGLDTVRSLADLMRDDLEDAS